jgi:hypothetical protein
MTIIYKNINIFDKNPVCWKFAIYRKHNHILAYPRSNSTIRIQTVYRVQKYAPYTDRIVRPGISYVLCVVFVYHSQTHTDSRETSIIFISHMVLDNALLIPLNIEKKTSDHFFLTWYNKFAISSYIYDMLYWIELYLWIWAVVNRCLAKFPFIFEVKLEN